MEKLVATVVKACADELQAFPELNARLDGEAIVYLDRYDIGVAVQTAQGLMVPVVRSCDAKTADEIHAELVSLAEQARDGTLAPEELRGSTFTVTSAGKLSGLFQTPIVNHPEVAILSIGRIAPQAGGARRRCRRPPHGHGRLDVRPSSDRRRAGRGVRPGRHRPDRIEHPRAQRRRARPRAGRVLPGGGRISRPAPRPGRLGKEPARRDGGGRLRGTGGARRVDAPLVRAGPGGRARRRCQRHMGASRRATKGSRPGRTGRARGYAAAMARVVEGTTRLGSRAGRALRRPHNWVQLAKFCAVGATGYVVNLAVFTLLYEVFSVHYRPAAVCSFVRRRHEQLPLEPPVDVPRPARPLLLPGAAVLHRRLVCARSEPPRAGGSREARARPDPGAGACHHRRHARELHRQQALVVPAPPLTRAEGARVRCRRALRAARGGPRSASPDTGTAAPPDRGTRGDDRPRRGRRARLGRPLSTRKPRHRGRVRRGVPGLDREGVVGGRRADRARARGRPHGARGGRVDRPAGGVADGPRRRGRLRRQAAEQPAGVARLLRGVRAGARRPPAAASGPQPRPPRARLAVGVALVLQRRADLHERAARLPGAALSPGSHVVDRPARPPARYVTPCLARLAAHRGDDLPGRLSHRARPRRLERHRRRLLRRHRGASHRERPGAVRPLPAGGGGGVRARRSLGARRAAHPGERALRGAERARRHVRPGDVSGVPARLCDLRLAGEGGPLACRALHGDRLRPRLPPRARARRAAVRGPAPGSDPRVRLGGLPLHPVRRELELERRHPARAARVRLLARGVALGPRQPRRSCLVDEVRGARRRAAVGDVPRAPCPAHGLLRRGLRGGDARGVLGAVARARSAGGGANRVGPDDRPPVRPGVALLALGLAAVPRRPARPSPRATGAAVAADRRCYRSGLRPATKVAASAGGAHGRAADRLRDRPHALVLPLRRVVLPVRRVRHLRPGNGRGRLAAALGPRW